MIENFKTFGRNISLVREGWYQLGAAFIIGILSCFAFAPYHIFPLYALSISSLLWLISPTTSAFRAFVVLTFFFLGYFTTSLSWVANAFDVAGMSHLKPLAYLGLPLLMAVIMGLILSLTQLKPLSPVARLFLFTALWGVAEWVRSWLFTGFPWNMSAHIWSLPVLQSTAYIGSFGLNLLTIFIAGSFYTLNKRLIVSALTLLGLLWVGGSLRLGSVVAFHEDIALRIIQLSIPQQKKWDPAHKMEHLHKLVEASQSPSPLSLKAVIWSEAAVTFLLDEHKAIREMIAEAAPKGGYLITGAPRQAFQEDKVIGLYNSLFVVDPRGAIITSYDKVHLVPFGEFIPLRSWINLPKTTFGALDYLSGPGFKTLEVSGLPPFSPLICYEAIFPGQVTDHSDKAQWLLNLTNDTWFGHSAGPYQHFHIVRIRAIEEGLPVLRAANNGISALISPYGTYAQEHHLSLNAVNVLDVTLPKALPGGTFYSKFREIPFWILCFFCAMMAFITAARNRKSVNNYHEQNNDSRSRAA